MSLLDSREILPAEMAAGARVYVVVLFVFNLSEAKGTTVKLKGVTEYHSQRLDESGDSNHSREPDFSEMLQEENHCYASSSAENLNRIHSLSARLLPLECQGHT